MLTTRPVPTVAVSSQGPSKRSDLGCVKHLSTVLWVQDRGPANVADTMTKPVSGQSISDMLKHLCFRAMRSALAYTTTASASR